MRLVWLVLVAGCVVPKTEVDGGSTEPIDSGVPFDAGLTTDAGDDLTPVFRAAARVRLASSFEGCASAWLDGGAETPKYTSGELAHAKAAAAIVDEATTIFDSAGVTNAQTATFGPDTWRGGLRRGSVRRDGDAGFVFEITVGGTVLVSGTRRGSTIEVVYDARGARDAGLSLGDGRAAFERGPTGNWNATTAVIAEWNDTRSSPLSTRATCARAEDAGLTFTLISATRDFDGDRLPDTLSVAAWSSDAGGRADATVSNGQRPSISGRVIECWNERLESRLKAASDGTTTVIDPPDAGLSRCPAPFDVMQLDAPVLNDVVLRQTKAAYDGLHRRLTFPRRPHRVLWVGAHPDDEGFYAAPILGHLCRELGGTCTFVVATDGSTGSCRVPQGCPPDLGTFRREEMRRAAAVYGATLVQLDWPPGPFPSETAIDLNRWSTAKGGTPALVTALRSIIDSVDPEIVLTFDPRHGGSCHAEHRVVSALTVQALRESGKTPAVYFSEGFSPPPRFVDDRLLMFDATEPDRHSGSDAWAYVTLNLAEHPSQITPVDLAGFTNVPAPLRRAYVLSGDELRADERYQVCGNP